MNKIKEWYLIQKLRWKYRHYSPEEFAKIILEVSIQEMIKDAIIEEIKQRIKEK